MKSLIIGLLLALSSFLSSYSVPDPNPKQATVYVCTGPKSVAYHKIKDCRGLKKCSKEIKEVTKAEAEDSMKRRKCWYCMKGE